MRFIKMTTLLYLSTTSQVQQLIRCRQGSLDLVRLLLKYGDLASSTPLKQLPYDQSMPAQVLEIPCLALILPRLTSSMMALKHFEYTIIYITFLHVSSIFISV